MDRIRETFQQLKSKKRKALIPYVTAGDPTLPVSKDIVVQLIERGADIIELGVPFSDPTADGPIIQAASQRALKNGVTMTDILALVEEIRESSQIPIILFGYYNPFFIYGPEKICQSAKDAGVDGLLVVDLPYEEADELKDYADQLNLDFIFLLAPTSDDDRIKAISGKARGFVYYVSMTGVTGSKQAFDHYAANNIRRIQTVTGLPVVIGFGISTPKQAHEMAKLSDGVVVGSALVQIIAENQGAADLPKLIGRFAAQLREVV